MSNPATDNHASVNTLGSATSWTDLGDSPTGALDENLSAEGTSSMSKMGQTTASARLATTRLDRSAVEIDI